MDSQTELQKPAPTLKVQPSVHSPRTLQTETPFQQAPETDYDPCQNAQKFSPFYMYNHDSPRPSTDLRPKNSINVSIRDLELGDITPSVTQEKMRAQKKTKTDMLNCWRARKQHCLTKPKKQWWLQRLPKKQRIAVKLLFALLVAGAMVGIAVGIAAALHSGVYGTDKVVGQHN